MGAGLEHETVDVEAGLAECAALEGDLAGALEMTEEAIATATRIGQETALGGLHGVRGRLLLQQGRPSRRPSRSSSSGSTQPRRGRVGVSAPSTCSAAAWRAREPGVRDEKDLQAALATLRELGVEVLPHGLGHTVA